MCGSGNGGRREFRVARGDAGDRRSSDQALQAERRPAEHGEVTFRLELSETIKARGSGAMRLPEAQVAHRVLGAIHSLPGVGIPDGLRHDSCNAPRLCRKARRPQFPGNGDAGFGRRWRYCARNPWFSARRCSLQPSAGSTEVKHLTQAGVARNYRLPPLRTKLAHTPG